MEGEDKFKHFGTEFVNHEMEEIAEGVECLKGYKLIVIFYNASWCF